ncbi:hypothetical protein PaeBR_20760 [Paenibacillus sp. BR2-3]|uniref:hypothetical protein n=1 Tax=Paenibacillus sp. BR2-3 TaxID=3048494 RepID=UPI003977D2BD
MNLRIFFTGVAHNYDEGFDFGQRPNSRFPDLDPSLISAGLVLLSITRNGGLA